MPITFAMTDIHGHLDILSVLVGKCQDFASKAGEHGIDPMFVFMGDYIDRGPDSAGVIAFLREFEKTNRSVFLPGNHDVMLINAIVDDDYGNWVHNGMRSTALSYGFNDPDMDDVTIEKMRGDKQVQDDVAWLQSLPYWYEDEHRIFVHAGIDPSVPTMAEQSKDDLVWIRDEFLNHTAWPFPKHIVHGHTPHRGDCRSTRNDRTNLDTGAFHSGVMTAGIFLDVIAPPVHFLTATKAEARDIGFLRQITPAPSGLKPSLHI